MGNTKVMIGFAALVLLGIADIVMGNAVYGAAVVIVTLALALVVRSELSSTEESFFEPPEERPARSKKAATVVDEPAPLPTFTPLAEPEPVDEEDDYDLTYEEAEEEEVEGLPSWGGGEPLAAWTPPEDTVQDTEEEEPSYGFEESELDEESTLAEFEELDFGDDDLSVLDAEFEEIYEEEPAELEFEAEFEAEEEEEPVVEQKPAAFSFGNNSKIKEIEDVHTDADIMKSSAATELAIADDKGENSELARLLAKVQSRLAAYE